MFIKDILILFGQVSYGYYQLIMKLIIIKNYIIQRMVKFGIKLIMEVFYKIRLL